MKKIGLLLMLFVSLISCSNNDSDDQEVLTDYYGKWIRFDDSKYITSTAVTEMFYIFNKDNTFVKTFVNNGVTTTAAGTLEIWKDEKVTYFKMTYSESSFLISSCTGGLSELLVLDKSNNLNDSAGMCDRYGTYKKAK